MFDTHCHLNFKAFKNSYDQVIKDAFKVGVKDIVIPGTDVETSQKAVEIAKKYNGVYAAIGIHPHHVYKLISFPNLKFQISNFKLNSNFKLKIKNSEIFRELEELIKNPKVVAVGEVGFDKYQYPMINYQQHITDEQIVSVQKKLLIEQIKLAIKHKKSLILHNREAKKEMLEILSTYWDKKLEGRTVFHCCEPDLKLLDFAIKHHIFIGVDGDVTYSKEKQEFVKKIPLDLLVLETDSPYLLPEPLRSQKQFPNVPANIVLVNQFVAKLLNKSEEETAAQTTNNAKILFLGSVD